MILINGPKVISLEATSAVVRVKKKSKEREEEDKQREGK